MPNDDAHKARTVSIIGHYSFLPFSHNGREIILSSWGAPKKTLARNIYRDWIESNSCFAVEDYTPIEEFEPRTSSNGISVSTGDPLDYLSYYFFDAKIADKFKQKFGGILALQGYMGHENITTSDVLTNLGWYGANVSIHMEKKYSTDPMEMALETPQPHAIFKEHEVYSWCEKHCEGGWFEESFTYYEGIKKPGFFSKASDYESWFVFRAKGIWFSRPEERDAFLENFKGEMWDEFDYKSLGRKMDKLEIAHNDY